jgi:hypothetical protein
MILQIEEVMSVIRALPIVTKLWPVPVRNRHGPGYQVFMRFSVCEEYGSCGKEQESPVQAVVKTKEPVVDTPSVM